METLILIIVKLDIWSFCLKAFFIQEIYNRLFCLVIQKNMLNCKHKTDNYNFE